MSMIPGTRDLVSEMTPRQRKAVRMGTVSSVAWAFKPPTCVVDGRNMRYASGIEPALHAGDVVLWLDNGAAPVVIGRLQGNSGANSAFQNLTYSGTWVAFGSPYETGRYWKDPDGFVYVQLVAKSGTLNTTIATLPAGYRPWQIHRFQGLCGPTSTGCRIDIDTAGNITMIRAGAGATNAYVSLVCRFQEVSAYNSSYPQWCPVPWVDGWAPINSFDAYPVVYQRDDGFCQAYGGITGGTNALGGLILPDRGRMRYASVISLPGLSAGAYQALRADVNHTMIQPVAGSNTEVFVDGMTWDSAIADHSFIGIAPAGTWVRYDTVFPTSEAYLDKYGVVHVRGLMKSGTANTTLLTLPATWRPGAKLVFPGVGDTKSDGRIEVNTDGTVVQAGTPGTGYFSLNTILFRAEL